MKYEYTYAAVTVEENGKYYSYVIKICESDNALCKLSVRGLIHANIFKTKKRACEAADYWNKCYKTNGTYLFDTPEF